MAADGTPAQPVICEPVFQQFSGSRCLTLRWPSVGHTRATVVVIQGFGDEANLSRRMVRLFAESAALHGFETCLIDCSGCGDSEGDLQEATPGQWLAELTDFCNMQNERTSKSLVLLGIRFGAVLALQLASRLPFATRFIAWAPMFEGSQQLRQLLRLGALKHPNLQKSAREQWARGETFRLGGYDLSAAMADGLKALTLPASFEVDQMLLIDVRPGSGSDEPVQVSPAINSIIERLADDRTSVSSQAVRGAPFWNVSDPVDCPALVDLSLSQLGQWFGDMPTESI